jgi:hypothetical protein
VSRDSSSPSATCRAEWSQRIAKARERLDFNTLYTLSASRRYQLAPDLGVSRWLGVGEEAIPDYALMRFLERVHGVPQAGIFLFSLQSGRLLGLGVDLKALRERL